MAYTFTELQNKLNEIEAWLKKELSSIRTGRATVTILDTVIVEVYGAKSPLNQNANITIEDPKTIRVAPWDKSLIPEIEKGITLADLGVSTSVDDEGVRIIFPDLTTETREKLVKKAKNKIEESKVSIRNERDRIWADIQSLQKNGDISEDEKFQHKEDMEKIIKEAQAKFDLLAESKEKEILS